MYRGLRARLTAVCAVSTGLVLVGMAAVSFRFSSAQMRRQFEQSFRSSAVSAVSYMGDRAILSHTWLMQTELENDIWIDVTTELAAMEYGAGNPERADIMRTARRIAREDYGITYANSQWTSGTEPAVFVMAAGDRHYRVFLTQIPWGNAQRLVTVVKGTDAEQRELFGLLLRFAGSVVISLGLLVLFAWLFSGWATRPVEESRKQQVEFVHAASHELRAPISVIQMGAEHMREATPDMVERFCGIILRECSRLTRLTGDLLRLAGADSRKMTINKQTIPPEAPLLAVYENYLELMKRNEIVFELLHPAEEPPRVSCDPGRIEQVLTILLDNAVRFVPRGGRIQLGLQTHRGSVCYTVCDNGPGIADDEKKKVFQRFYQSDRSRSGKEHYGLGLSIACEIAALHRGKLTVTDSDWGGCAFALHLPVNRSEKP